MQGLCPECNTIHPADERCRVRCDYCGGSGATPEESEEGYTGREVICPNCNGSGSM